MAVYTVTLSKSVTGSTLAYEERVLYGRVDVGGFSVTFTPASGVPLKSFTRTVVKNDLTSVLLDQQVDISYGGEVIAHAYFTSTPPVAPDTVHGLSCYSSSDRAGDLPMVFTCDILPPA
jgi:hypothetical protein